VAGDLIPPPSPAGKPDPLAPERERAERDRELKTAAEASEAIRDPVAAAPPSRYRSRFGFVTGALVGIALAAMVIVGLVVAGRKDPVSSAGPSWSSWQPTSTNRLVQAAEIADHVGREYRLNDGSQLVDVEAGPLSINDVPLTPVVRTAAKGGDIVPIYGTGVLYVLNGLGDNGSISKETPSAKRLALVEREALELSLYTFRYVKGVDHVVAMLPPAPASSTATTSGSGGSGGSAAAPGSAKRAATNAADAANVASSGAKPIPTMLFRPGDLRTQLSAPLALTFPAQTPRPATISNREAELLTQFTQNNVFEASVVPNQTGQGYLVLDRPSVTTAVEKLLQSTIPKSGK
jgi:hypothetical protein